MIVIFLTAFHAGKTYIYIPVVQLIAICYTLYHHLCCIIISVILCSGKRFSFLTAGCLCYMSQNKTASGTYDNVHENTSSSAVADRQTRPTRCITTNGKCWNIHVTTTTLHFLVICNPVARIDIAYLWTKFDDFRFSRSSDMTGAPTIFNDSRDLTTPLSGTVCRPWAVTCKFNLCIKFVVFAIANYEDA